MMKCLATILIFIVSIDAHASQLTRCLVYLTSARTNHASEELSEENTDKAFHEFNLFRGRYLSQFEGHPDSPSVTAIESSPDSQKEIVADRLAGLFADRSVLAKKIAIGVPLKERIYGSVYEGQIDIRKELDARETVRRASESRTCVRNSRVVPFVLGGAYACGAVVLNEVMGHFTNPIIQTIMVSLLIGTRNYPEQLHRMLYEAFGPTVDEKQVFANLNRSSDKRWAYRSFNIRIPLDLVHRIWQAKDYSNADFEQFINNYAAPRSTYFYTTNQLYLPGAAQEDPNSGWVRIDELIVQEPRQQPKLITFVRVSEALMMSSLISNN